MPDPVAQSQISDLQSKVATLETELSSLKRFIRVSPTGTVVVEQSQKPTELVGGASQDFVLWYRNLVVQHDEPIYDANGNQIPCAVVILRSANNSGISQSYFLEVDINGNFIIAHSASGTTVFKITTEPHLVIGAVKTDTGDPDGESGKLYINEFDNAVRYYADGAWRSLATWNGTGFTNLGSGSELTISGGAITVTASYHSVDTEADASADDLDTINGGSTGDLLLLESVDNARDVTIKEATGNIFLQANTDNVMGDTTDKMLLVKGTDSNWYEIRFSNN